MKTITEVYQYDKSHFESRTLEQVIGFSGEGKLRDGNNTSTELRDLISIIPTKLLTKYINYCLDNSFKDSGIALQDLINEVGSRLGFISEYGRYRGVKNDIGYDGLWKTKSGYSFVVEVKTTDAYRINLDTLNKAHVV